MRDVIARALDDEPAGDATLGGVTLRPHQRAAVRLLRRALRDYGGALLADAPGLGKTFTALALAREATRCVVCAPAALRRMWQEAASTAAQPVTFVSLERLSRGVPVPPADFVIVDEAHHAAHPRTRRYAALSAAASRAHLLLLTATPVRNHSAERDALLALFLGPRAAAVGDDVVARCVLRRDAVAGASPHVERQPPVRIPATRGLAARIAALPPPLAPEDGAAATGLVRMGLARACASSVAAVDRMLRHREQRGLSLLDALRAGRLPTRADLRLWVHGDDAVQLPLLPDAPAALPNLAAFTAVVATHLDGVREVRRLTRAARAADSAARADALLAIAARHDGEIAIAFTGYEATAVALWRALRAVPGVVLLTGRGAMTAGGPVPRAAVLDALAPEGAAATSRAFAPRLVIATDVLAEGVNLQRASVVVHLDWPWTPAALAQRVGRAARIGAHHARVVEYRFAPPSAADRLVRTAWRHDRKDAAGTAAVAPARNADALRTALAPWRRDGAPAGSARVAAAWGRRDAWIVRVDTPARPLLLAVLTRRARHTVTDRATDIATIAAAQSDDAAPDPGPGDIRRVHASVMRWIARSEGRAAAGRGATFSVAARRVSARLARVVAHCPPARMASVASRVGRVRAIMAQARGLAVELHYHAMCERHVDAAEWLEELECRLRDVPLMLPGDERATIAALLAVRRR